MAIGDIQIYGGKHYIKQGPISGCSECAFYNKEDGCEAFNSELDNCCYNDQSVWKEYTGEIQEKYTVEEVIDCMVESLWITRSDRETAIKSVNKRIKLTSDPDYKTFLQLKEKFKDI